jgi:hypothetical protein
MRRLIINSLLFACIFFNFRLQLYAQEESNLNSQTKVDDFQTVKYQPLQFKTGFNLGWESPYSAGIEFSFLFNELIDANFGFGLGLSGTKLGIGSRIYPNRTKKISPMFGVYYYHANGLKSLNVSVNEVTGVYDISSDNALLINAGIRFRFSKGHYLISSIGYSHPFKGEKAIYQGGSMSSDVESFANMFATGGFSINVGILLKVNKGHYKQID